MIRVSALSGQPVYDRRASRYEELLGIVGVPFAVLRQFSIDV